MPNTETKNRGLQPLPFDKRDFSHDQVFGSAKIIDLPDEYLAPEPLEYKNQDINYLSDYCTIYGLCSVAEDEDGEKFLPEWLFAQVKAAVAKRDGPDVYNQYGLNLRDVCLGAVNIGFLPRMYDPYACDTTKRPPRSFILDLKNWYPEFLTYAAAYKKASFFSVDGPYDTFDNIRSALWLNRAENRSVLAGCIWRESWNTAPFGIIPEQYEITGGGHAFKIRGWKVIEGETFLVAQMSDGQNFGDGGQMYFSRWVANNELGTFGSFTFKDLPQQTAKLYQQCDVKIHDALSLKVVKLLNNWIKTLCPHH